jgi:hypothetical protein
MSSSVKLYVYDLSKGLARQMSRQLTGRQIDGIWSVSRLYISVGTQPHPIRHTSIVIFGKEYSYGQGINVNLPGRSHVRIIPLFPYSIALHLPKHGSPFQSLDMGQTSIDEDTFNDYITAVREHYTADKVSNSHLKCLTCSMRACIAVPPAWCGITPDLVGDGL